MSEQEHGTGGAPADAPSQSWLQGSSPQVAGGAAGSGNPRQKIGLRPGFGLTGWYTLTRTVTSLSGVPDGQLLRVTSAELAKHKSREDAWTAIRGKVYNITVYMDYHPGGVDKLMMAAGRDGTSLFDKYHPWVNVDFLLEKTLVGFLQDS